MTIVDHSAPSGGQIITEDEYQLFSFLLDRLYGRRLMNGGMLTFHMKVSHRLTILGLRTFREYHDYLVSDQDGTEAALLMSHLANHQPHPFADRQQFALLSAFLAERFQSSQSTGSRGFRMLSAASANGAEAYMLSALWRGSGICRQALVPEIIGIDISSRALAKAREARYSRDAFGNDESDERYRKEHFIADGNEFVIKPQLREGVEFRLGNLVQESSLAGLGSMDMIFCRHVLGSMTESGIQRSLRNLHNLLAGDGYLFIGTSESIIQHTNLFLPVRLGSLTVYRKSPDRKRHTAIINTRVCNRRHDDNTAYTS